MSTSAPQKVAPTQSAQIVSSVIGAGDVYPIFQTGDKFYVIISTGEIEIKPQGYSANNYSQGKGLRTPNPFPNIQLRNNTANSIVFSIFVGFGDYIDNTTILFDPQVSEIVYPTYPVPNAASDINVADLSGQAFTDINGTEWLAIARSGIYMTNYDLATTYALQNTALNKTAIGVPPSTDIVFPVNGNFKVHVPAGNINMVVSEVYRAISPTLSL